MTRLVDARQRPRPRDQLPQHARIGGGAVKHGARDVGGAVQKRRRRADDDGLGAAAGSGQLFHQIRRQHHIRSPRLSAGFRPGRSRRASGCQRCDRRPEEKCAKRERPCRSRARVLVSPNQIHGFLRRCSSRPPARWPASRIVQCADMNRRAVLRGLLATAATTVIRVPGRARPPLRRSRFGVISDVHQDIVPDGLERDPRVRDAR